VERRLSVGCVVPSVGCLARGRGFAVAARSNEEAGVTSMYSVGSVHAFHGLE
jgi:hypothetical protein